MPFNPFNLFGAASAQGSDQVVTTPMSREDVLKRLSSFSSEQIQDEADLDLPSNKENTDWLKWLQDPKNATPAPTSKSNSIILIGGIAAFVLVVLVFTLFSKK